MPGFAWYTPVLTGVFHFRLLRVDSGLLPHVGWLLGELGMEHNWFKDESEIPAVLVASNDMLALYYLNPMIGMIQGFLGDIPEGWLSLDGSTHDQADFPLLSERLGDVYRNDGAGTFTLPDFAAIVAVGAGGGLSLGDEGGEASVSLAVDEMPAHTHTYVMPTVAVDTVGVGAPLPVVDSATPATPTGSSGSGTAHENRPPFHVVNYGIFSGIA